MVDPSGADVAPGESGEVIVRGKHVMREYWNSPEATAETIRDGWLYTGDGATGDEDGYVYIQDRIKDMIISGGENVYPAEVEGVLMQHPGIGDAAVIGQSSARWGESAVAIVVRKDPALDTAGVLAFVSDKLARYKQPVAVEFVDEVPRNPSGKVLKRVLREQFPGPPRNRPSPARSRRHVPSGTTRGRRPRRVASAGRRRSWAPATCPPRCRARSRAAGGASPR